MVKAGIVFFQTEKLLNLYRTWENFGVGKNWRIWQIEGHSPIFYLPMFLFRISFSYTCGSFANTLPSN